MAPTERQVTLTVAALADLNEARQWLHQAGAGRSARARYQELSAAIRGLAAFPARHRRNPDNPRLRIASVAGHRIVFRIDPDTGDNDTAGDVTVLAVLGPGEV